MVDRLFLHSWLFYRTGATSVIVFGTLCFLPFLSGEKSDISTFHPPFLILCFFFSSAPNSPPLTFLFFLLVVLLDQGTSLLPQEKEAPWGAPSFRLRSLDTRSALALFLRPRCVSSPNFFQSETCSRGCRTRRRGGSLPFASSGVRLPVLPLLRQGPLLLV